MFDLDATLIDQASASAPAVREWGAELGLPTDAIVERWAALSSRHYARYQAREISFQGQRRERVRGLLERELEDDEADELFAGYLWRYEAGWALYADAVPCLDRLKDAGVALGVLTNGDRTQQMQKIDRFGLAPYFDAIVCSSDLPYGKPHPGAFEAAASALGRAAADIVMVGDSIENDAHGALKAGMRAVLLDRDDAYTGDDLTRITTLDELTHFYS
nr:HAD family hydrolase [Microbacterium pseudoresistens]